MQVGDYGLGYCANSLELGCDCLGKIHYFDADMVDSAGALPRPVTPWGIVFRSWIQTARGRPRVFTACPVP